MQPAAATLARGLAASPRPSTVATGIPGSPARVRSGPPPVRDIPPAATQLMNTHHHTWAVVLAAGEGSRLRSLTTDASGRSTPKQYCSLFGGSTLLEDAVRRGQAIAGRERLCAIVAAQHAEWSTRQLSALAPGNVITQPRNRGTANGVLLSLLSILARDPRARILFLPADHFVEDEARLAVAMRTALAEIDAAPGEMPLIGIEPDDADPELGYVVPGDAVVRARRVARFVEKPFRSVAAELLAQGAVWNSFIFAATGTTLLGMFRERVTVDSMETALARAAAPMHDRTALADLYATLPDADFSRAILAAAVPQLRVVTAEACGWSDLGTPRRIGEVVCRVGPRVGLTPGPKYQMPGSASLATAYLRPQMAV
jgi:mannose-1-phosphate guanylyltransferase